MTATPNYEQIISASERVTWKIDEVIPLNKPLDFSKPFLPESLVLSAEATFLTAPERLKLNQIRANSYAHLFQFVEEYIVATCVQYASADVFGEEQGLRAMLRFAEEEVKHQLLFKRFLKVFAAGFATPVSGIPSQEAVAGVISSKSPMAVMAITLHLEVMTQQHYVQCVSNAEELDPTCKGMLKAHWMEEAQHAKLDAITLRRLAQTATPEQRTLAVKEYLELIDALVGLLGQQAGLDIASLETAIGKKFTDAEKKVLLESQAKAYRQTFVTWGATNPTFVETMKDLFGDDAKAIDAKISQLN
ncbi:MAG: diiron oxygenase [Archangium sp.]